MSTVNIKEASRINWVTKVKEGDYPGDTNIQLGCLMRIADASEKMAANYTRMENDLAMYKRWYEEEKASNRRLLKSNAALRGYINRLKK